MRVQPGVLVIGLALAGCPFGDPPGPGASGQVSLAPGLQTGGFATLELRAYPDRGVDPAAAVPTAPPLLAESLGLSGLTFPYAYTLFDALGTTPEAGWRVTAWLATTAGQDVPTHGDLYGSQTFLLRGCGQYGGYCDITTGVDVVISSAMP